MQLLRLATTVVLVRLLTPDAFGLVAIAEVAIGFAEIVARVGFGVAIVQARSLDYRLLHTVFWANLTLFIILFLILFASAPFIAQAYGNPQLRALLIVLSLNLVINSFTVVPLSMLTRRMHFRNIALREVGATAVYGVTAIGLALVGCGVWALVYGSLISSLFQAIILMWSAGYRPQLYFSRSILRQIISLGLNLTGVNVFNYFSRQVDRALIGLYAGSASLGVYVIACKLIFLPREIVGRVLIRVLLPTLSQVQDDPFKIKALYLRAIAMLALLTFPIMGGMAVLAVPIVALLFGTGWEPSAPIIQILATVGALQCLIDARTQVLLIRGKARTLLILTIAECGLYTLSILLGVYWGVQGVSVALLIAVMVVFPISTLVVARAITNTALIEVYATILPSAISTFVMCALVAFFKAQCEIWGLGNATTLMLAIPWGAFVYIVGTYFGAHDDLLRLLRLLNPRSAD